MPTYSPTGEPRAGRVLLAGEEFTVTPQECELSKDRLGISWLDMTDAEQSQRWGMIRFQEGTAPEGFGIGEDDEYTLYKRALALREEARLISHPRERAEALAEISKKYHRVLHPVAETSRDIPQSSGF